MKSMLKRASLAIGHTTEKALGTLGKFRDAPHQGRMDASFFALEQVGGSAIAVQGFQRLFPRDRLAIVGSHQT